MKTQVHGGKVFAANRKTRARRESDGTLGAYRISIRTRLTKDYTGKNSESHAEFMAEHDLTRYDCSFAARSG